ncbi:DUF6273 domain-containing protein [Butyrivibrio sp. AD3002]|uniref:DUF6273 domain-containing protein n=1 Tax=Butyrivibrio sp. AD3002 TaxID=1280670 RepID=UPI0003B5202D|nr:DUF6273 domain-containing protein [Butyrivibrio sp. AD3002]
MVAKYNRDRVVWWLRSPGNNDNNAACVNGGNADENGNNVNKKLAVRPALPGRPKCMEGSMRQCIRQRNPVPFHGNIHGKTHAVGACGRESFHSIGNG